MYLLYIILLNANLAMIILFYFQSTVTIATCNHFIIFYIINFVLQMLQITLRIFEKIALFRLAMETNLWKICFKGGLSLIFFRVSSIAFFFSRPIIVLCTFAWREAMDPLEERSTIWGRSNVNGSLKDLKIFSLFQFYGKFPLFCSCEFKVYFHALKLLILEARWTTFVAFIPLVMHLLCSPHSSYLGLSLQRTYIL